MLLERGIKNEWVEAAILSPDMQDVRADQNAHYFKGITERGGRILHVVVNPKASPQIIVTAFFDRRARKTK